MQRKIILALVVVLIVLAVSLLAYQIFVQQERDTYTILRALLIIAGLFCTVLRVAGPRQRTKKQTLAAYEIQYKHIIRKAFSNPEKAEQKKKLLHCIDLFNKDQCYAAIKELKKLYKVCQFRDDYCAVLAFLAICHEDVGDKDAAIEMYEKVLEYDQDFSTVWSNLSILYGEKGQYDGAIRCGEKAVLYNKENALAYNNLAHAHYYCGNYEEAIEYAKTALEKNGKTYQAATLLCLIYYLFENEEESDRYYTLAVANGQKHENIDRAKMQLR